MSGNPDYDGDGWDWPDAEWESDEREYCLHCGAEIDHYVGCPEDPDPDWKLQAEQDSMNAEPDWREMAP